MVAARAIPAFAVSGAPVSVLVDFDGTISLADVTDHLLDEYATDKDWRRRDAEYQRDEAGTRELIEWDVAILDADEATLRREASTQRLDAGFATLVETVRRHGAAIEVVSDGLGFYVQAALERLHCGDVPVATAAIRFGGGVRKGAGDTAKGRGCPQNGDGTSGRVPSRVEFPFGHPNCFVCGTCKRERVRAHQAAGRVVVYVGDGQSDRYGAHHADVVFAKHRLAAVCAEDGQRFSPWQQMDDVARWIECAFGDGGLPASRADVAAWRARRSAAAGDFICGPEAWGSDRSVPRQVAGR